MFAPDPNQPVDPSQQMSEPPPVAPISKPAPASSTTLTWREVLPPEFRDGTKPDTAKLQALCICLYGCVEGSKSARDLIFDRVTTNERFYHNRPDKPVASIPYDEAPHYHIPTVGPRLQQRKASLVDTLLGPDKFFYLESVSSADGSQDIEDAVEDDLQFLVEISGFDEVVEMIADTIMPANIAIVRHDYYQHDDGADFTSVTGPYAGFKHDVIHPFFFHAFPAHCPQIARQKLVGHDFELRVAEVQERIRKGIWIDQTVIPTTQSLRMTLKDTGKQDESTPVDKDDLPVKLGDFLIKYAVDDNSDEKYYRVIADTDNYNVYRIEPYEKSRPWYVAYRIYKNLNSFWSEDSPANDGQSANMMMNALVNNALWQIQYATGGIVIGRATDGQDSVKKIAPHSFIPGKPGESTTITSNSNLSGVQFLIEFVSEMSDVALKVPDTVSGGSAKDETATAQQIKFQGYQLTGGQDIKALTPSFRQSAMVLLDIYYENWSDIWQTYGTRGVIKTQNAEWLKEPLSVSLAGQKPKAAPAIQQQELSSVLALIAENPELAQNMELMLELTEKFVNQTSIEGKEDIVKAIKRTAAGNGQWMQVIDQLQKIGFTPQSLVQFISQSSGIGGTQQGQQPPAVQQAALAQQGPQ